MVEWKGIWVGVLYLAFCPDILAIFSIQYTLRVDSWRSALYPVDWGPHIMHTRGSDFECGRDEKRGGYYITG